MEIKSYEDFKFEDELVGVDDVSITYLQNSDCTEEDENAQSIIISTRNNGVGRFINIKTENWSFNDVDELIKLIAKFTKSPEQNPIKLKTVKDLQLMDDIWVKEDGEIYSGWVWDISRRCITVIYGEDIRDYKFQMQKPLNRTTIEQDNKILFCNKPE